MQTIQKAERSVAGGGFAGAAPSGLEERTTTTTATSSPTPTNAVTTSDEPRGQKVRAMLRAQLGDDIFTSWFHTLEFESFEGRHGEGLGPGQVPQNLDPVALLRRSPRLLPRRVQGRGEGRGGAAPAGRQRRAARPSRSRRHRLANRPTARAELARADNGQSRAAFVASHRRRPDVRASAASRARLSIRATRSTASSSARRTAWHMPAPRRSPKRRSARLPASIRSTSTPRSASAKRISCTPSPGR